MCSEMQMERIHILYRAHQVLHGRVCEFMAPVIAIAFSISCLFQIFAFSLLILTSHDMSLSITLFLAIAGPLAAASTKVCLDFATRYSDGSCMYKASFYQWSCEISKVASRQDDHLKLYHSMRRKFKSCRPFYFKIGSFFHIRRTTFVVASSDVVLQNVLTFLLIS